MGTRITRPQINIVFSLIGRFVAAVCGLLVSKLLIKAYGSEAYGAIDSITKFLAYIALLDGGVSGVARAALYKPLAINDYKKVSEIMIKIQKFFRIIALIFLLYLIVLAVSYKQISRFESLDSLSTFILVIVIGMSVFMEYFIGMSYGILINASQKIYVNQLIAIVTAIINAILVVILVSAGSGMILTKFISGLVYASRPILMWLYVKKNYKLVRTVDTASYEPDLLDQKWIGLAQHIAYILHKNTDVVVLTIFGDLKLVAVYAVYSMIVSGIESVALSFSSGMEARFGELLAKEDNSILIKTFDKYESMISVVSGILFSVTAVMIIPFVGIYTRDVEDVNYIYPTFALMIVLVSYLFCIRMPYHAIVTASGSFKQTQIASYGESIINAVLSVLLVLKLGLPGVAVGSVIAVCFRFLYYVFYLKSEVMHRRIKHFAIRMVNNLIAFISVLIIGKTICNLIVVIDNFIKWGLSAILITSISILVWSIVEHAQTCLKMKYPSTDPTS